MESSEEIDPWLAASQMKNGHETVMAVLDKEARALGAHKTDF
jgi:hypothetical protein